MRGNHEVIARQTNKVTYALFQHCLYYIFSVEVFLEQWDQAIWKQRFAPYSCRKGSRLDSIDEGEGPGLIVRDSLGVFRSADYGSDWDAKVCAMP